VQQAELDALCRCGLAEPADALPELRAMLGGALQTALSAATPPGFAPPRLAPPRLAPHAHAHAHAHGRTCATPAWFLPQP